jgi:hypothetical protein
LSNKKNNFLAFSLLFIQPIFMASNLIVARGAAELIPPISLGFLEMVIMFYHFTSFYFWLFE